METIIVDLNYLGESSQEQLNAYRKLGSVRSLKLLKQQEARRRRRRAQIISALKILFWCACVAFDIWLLASFIDTALHNSHPYPVYQAWNFFALFF